MAARLAAPKDSPVGSVPACPYPIGEGAPLRQEANMARIQRYRSEMQVETD
jgi:hypothetical protein